MTIKDFKGAVFDFDGTLVDSMNMWTEIDIEYLARYGHEFTADLQTDIEGMSTDEMAVYFRKRYNIPRTNQEMREDWEEMSREKYLHEIQLKPNVKKFLDYVKNNGLKIAIATSTELSIALPCLKSHEISGYFDAVATTTEAGCGKPAPDVYLLAAKKLELKPMECIAFEDLPAGIEAAKKAGMFTVAVDDSFSSDRVDEKKALSDMFIFNYREIYE